MLNSISKGAQFISMRRYFQFQYASLFGLVCLAVGSAPLTFGAGQSGSPTAAARIVNAINESNSVKLVGNKHPLAVPQYDQGAVPDNLPLEHMFLQLRRSPEQEQALQHLIDELHDPHSANYHKWLTTDQLGREFGPAQQDIDTVVQWLTLHGLQVNAVHPNATTIDVSGTAGQVRDAFHTEIHQYDINGQQHIANANDPEIPAALAPVVAGIASLHDFRPKPLIRRLSPSFTVANGEAYDVAPADFATIYNVTPLYRASKPITGKGQTIAVLEESNINAADVATFRKAFGLSKYSGTFRQIHPGSGCSDPGKNDAEGEAALDAEWAGAVAPDARVLLASCADTATNAGVFIAAQNLLNGKTPPPIMSLSFIFCEANQGPSGNAFLNSLWQQAAGEGVSVYVAAGDGGAAGCDNFDLFPTWATGGIAVNSLGSTPYNVATGGTDFLDTFEGTNSTYWSNSNCPTGKSVKSYVPEMTWNDSCASSILFEYYGYKNGVAFCNSSLGSSFLDIIGGSGGPSFVYPKPTWQAGILGIPNDGKRDLPDVSLFASNGFWSHALLFCMSDTNHGGTPCHYSNPSDVFANSAGGTSFTAPQFAGIQALINQKTGSRQGNPNPAFYRLAKFEYGSPTNPNTNDLIACNANRGKGVSTSCIFRDVTTGDIDVPCFGTNNCYQPARGQYGVLSVSDSHLVVAYPAHGAWDFATGLGSVNVARLVTYWHK
jgi:subtilase family serine protease